MGPVERLGSSVSKSFHFNIHMNTLSVIEIEY